MEEGGQANRGPAAFPVGDGGAPLVVCVGNPLRQDDGVAWCVADRLESDAVAVGARVVRCLQLVPELALDVARASRLVVVDAAADRPPGQVDLDSLEATQLTGPFDHDLDPGGLLSLAASVAGSMPPAVVVTVGAGRLGFGEGLSPGVAAAVPEAAARVGELLAAST